MGELEFVGFVFEWVIGECVIDGSKRVGRVSCGVGLIWMESCYGL